MHRTANRRIAPTPPRGRARWAWLAALICALALAACTGGSGSSGFDLALQRENKAIDTALTDQTCEMNDGLIICPSGAEVPTPTATMAAPANSPTWSSTPAGIGTPTPTAESNVTASATPTGGHLTATVPSRTPTPSPPFNASQTPTFTAIPMAPNIGTNVGDGDVVSCTLLDTQNPCLFVFRFEPQGLPSGAAYRVGVRTRNPNGNWLILPVVDNSALIEIDTSPAAPDYQLAVLVFTTDPPFVPEEVELLADTGANYAFITQVLMAVTQ